MPNALMAIERLESSDVAANTNYVGARHFWVGIRFRLIIVRPDIDGAAAS